MQYLSQKYTSPLSAFDFSETCISRLRAKYVKAQYVKNTYSLYFDTWLELDLAHDHTRSHHWGRWRPVPSNFGPLGSSPVRAPPWTQAKFLFQIWCELPSLLSFKCAHHLCGVRPCFLLGGSRIFIGKGPRVRWRHYSRAAGAAWPRWERRKAATGVEGDFCWPSFGTTFDEKFRWPFLGSPSRAAPL